MGRREWRREEEKIRSNQMDSYTYQRIQHISTHVHANAHVMYAEIYTFIFVRYKKGSTVASSRNVNC